MSETDFFQLTIQASIVGATPQRSSTALVVLSFPYSTDPPEFETDGLFYTLVDAVEGKCN